MFVDPDMRSFLLAFLILALLPAVARASADELKLVGSEQRSPRLTELTFTTPAVEGETRVRVLLPAGYDADPSRRYPVLFLLHGGADDYRSWTDKGDAEAITAGVPLIVVMPDSGPGGGYVNWFNSGEGGPPQWETYHLNQLLPWIDEHYRTVGTREGRAIAGLSMGGGGTMSYAARHPDFFAAAAAWSGALDSNRPTLIALNELTTGGAAYGPRATEEVRWRGTNPWDLAENLRGIDLTVRTGNGLPGGPGGDTGDPIEWEVHKMSIKFHERLTELGLPHVWDDYGPGGHVWFYWQRDLRQLMTTLERVFADPPDPPARVNLKRVEPVYGAWDWKVRIDRPALEWSELRGATRRGFSLSGSGTGTITTPPLYKARSKVRVTLSSGDGVTRRTLKVRRDCRLKIDVPLGRANEHQQYTPQALAAGGTKVVTTRVRIGSSRRCAA